MSAKRRPSKPELKQFQEYRRFSLARNFRPADFVTILNGFCGAGSILCTLSLLVMLPPHASLELSPEELSVARYAFGLPFLGMAFDILDGRVARYFQDSSMLGQELDSLADLVSFGVAPASLAFAVGLRSLIDVWMLAFFVCAGIARLARFNVTTHLVPKDTTGKSKYFQGMPIPSSLCLVAVMWAATEYGYLPWILQSVHLFGQELHLFSLVWFLWSFMMISSTLRVPKL